jgi:hypothetical protein
MTGGQVVALIFAILLLLPGGCFLIAGIAVATDPRYWDASFFAFPIAAAILGLSGFLFWRAFRRKHLSVLPPNSGGNPPVDPPASAG